MKKAGILMAAFALALSLGSFASAAVVDTVQYPTGNFVDVDANKYSWPYYRWYGDDWGWTHNAIGGSITSADLSISAYDVDAPSEVDKIYAYDNGVKTLLGSLAGGNDIWSYTTFILGPNFFDDINAGLQVWMEIDTGTQGSWAVTLAKSVLRVDGGRLPDPTPGTPGNVVPEPSTFALIGAGLLGIGLFRKRAQK